MVTRDPLNMTILIVLSNRTSEQAQQYDRKNSSKDMLTSLMSTFNNILIDLRYIRYDSIVCVQLLQYRFNWQGSSEPDNRH
jgi:hypothetical protein